MLKRRQNKIIKFSIRENYQGLKKPVKASKAFPAWFKKLERYNVKGDLETGTVKTCIPFIDAMSLGYIVPLWADLRIVVEDELELYDQSGKRLFFNEFPMVANVNLLNKFLHQPNFIKTFNDVVGMQTPDGVVHSVKKGELNIWSAFNESFGVDSVGGLKEDIGTVAQHPPWQVGGGFDRFRLGKAVLKLHAPWLIQCPKGYSLYFKNPPNHHEHDLELFEGLVDTDTYPLNINMPFLWRGKEKGDFFIKEGIALCQVIPIKRETFDEEWGVFTKKQYLSASNILGSKFVDRYKTFWWHKRKQEDDE